MENIISSSVRWIKKKVDSAKKAISNYAGRVINLAPEPIRRFFFLFKNGEHYIILGAVD